MKKKKINSKILFCFLVLAICLMSMNLSVFASSIKVETIQTFATKSDFSVNERVAVTDGYIICGEITIQSHEDGLGIFTSELPNNNLYIDYVNYGFVMKFNFNNEVVWKKLLYLNDTAEKTFIGEYTKRIVSTPSGYSILSNTVYDDVTSGERIEYAHIVDMDVNGNILSDNVVPSVMYSSNMAKTSNGDLVIVVWEGTSYYAKVLNSQRIIIASHLIEENIEGKFGIRKMEKVSGGYLFYGYSGDYQIGAYLAFMNNELQIQWKNTYEGVLNSIDKVIEDVDGDFIVSTNVNLCKIASTGEILSNIQTGWITQIGLDGRGGYLYSTDSGELHNISNSFSDISFVNLGARIESILGSENKSIIIGSENHNDGYFQGLNPLLERKLFVLNASLQTGSGEIIINGDIKSSVISFSVPTTTSFIINPNTKIDAERFIAPEILVSNSGTSVLSVGIEKFEQAIDTGHSFIDTLPSIYTDEQWKLLSKEQSNQQFALSIKAKNSAEWRNLSILDSLSVRQIKDNAQIYNIGALNPSQSAFFVLEGKHGNAFNSLIQCKYTITFIFSLF